jgi:hypothetical protein
MPKTKQNSALLLLTSHAKPIIIKPVKPLISRKTTQKVEDEVSDELNPMEIEEMNKMLNRETPFSSYQSSLKLGSTIDLKLPELNRMSPET